MPRSCSIKGCKSNYRGPSITTYALPKDEELKKRWLGIIPNDNDISKIKHAAICIKHFNENDIVRIDRCLVRGEYKEYPRKIPKLKETAVPCIFPIVFEEPRNIETAKRLKVKEKNPTKNVSLEKMKTNDGENNNMKVKEKTPTKSVVLEEIASLTNDVDNNEVTIKEEPLDESENVAESSIGKEEDSSTSLKKMKPIPARHEYIEHKVNKREAIFGLFVASEMSTLGENPLLYIKTKQIILKALSDAQLEHLNSSL